MAEDKYSHKELLAATAKFSKECGRNIVKASKLKEYCQALGLRMDGTLPEAVAEEVFRILLRGAKRCVGNKRTTVRPVDL